jgi:hypothetical protein
LDGKGQHGCGDRAQPGRDQVGRLPHRYRARGRGFLWGDRGDRDAGESGGDEKELYGVVFEGDAGEGLGEFLQFLFLNNITVKGYLVISDISDYIPQTNMQT